MSCNIIAIQYFKSLCGNKMKFCGAMNSLPVVVVVAVIPPVNSSGLELVEHLILSFILWKNAKYLSNENAE